MDLMALADRFVLDAQPVSVEPLGSGNVNTTYRVTTGSGRRYVLQRLNTAVFAEPHRVMGNLQALALHARDRGAALQVPLPVPVRAAPAAAQAPYLLQERDGPWRLLTYIEDTHSLDWLTTAAQATEIGRALGRFHVLVHDLPLDQLADTLEGFHVTPRYYDAYRARSEACPQGSETMALAQGQLDPLPDPRAAWCARFIAEREPLVPVLEQARAEGRLQLRAIHGDPKVNNVMLCNTSGCAVAMVDLDTVKPGLLHYDIGDALRSGCNPAGEETTDLEAVHFDLELAAAMLGGYLGEAASLLSADDIAHLYDAIRLLPFELGLRFFSDHLAGNTYFTVTRPDHNLDRALVQFRLTESIEAQEGAIRQLIARLTGPQP